MKKIIIFTIIFITALTIFFLIDKNRNFHFNDFENEELEWYYLEEDEKVYIDFPFKKDVNINEKVTIFCYIPENYKSISGLFYRTIYQSLEVKIDDEIVYEYKGNGSDSNFSIGRKMNVVNLPDDINGKTISITISSPYYKYSGYFSDIEIGSTINLLNTLNIKYSLSMIVSISILVINLCFILVNYLFYKSQLNAAYMVFLFLSGIFLGSWLLGDSQLITLYVNEDIANYLMYCGLMGFSALFAFFINKIFNNKIFINKFILYLGFLNLLIQIILHSLNIFDFVYMMPFTLLFILILFICYFINLIKVSTILKNENIKPTFNFIFEFIVVILLLASTVFNIVIQNISNLNINIMLATLYFLLIVIIHVKTIVHISEKAVESTVYKARLKETQNYLMQSQMKPHFIFNTLGALRTLIINSPKEAYDMTTNFSKYLRANIGTIDPAEKILFSQELDHIKAYVAIEKVRFKDRINVVYDINCESFSIPPLSVEPLVENAIKHGICKNIKGGTVKISSHELDDKYVITVEDDGVGFDTSILDDNENNSKSIGLKYIILRLKEISEADFQITSEIGKGTKATIYVYK